MALSKEQEDLYKKTMAEVKHQLEHLDEEVFAPLPMIESASFLSVSRSCSEKALISLSARDLDLRFYLGFCDLERR